MVVLGDSGPVWSPCTMMIGASNYCHFLTIWTLVVEAVPTSMRCQYTSNKSVEFVHRLCCYENSNGISLTTVLKNFACVRIWCTNVSHIKCVEAQTGIIHLFWIYHYHSNRNILSPILLTCSDDISLILRLSSRPIDKWIWRAEPGIDLHVILQHNEITAKIAKFMMQVSSHMIGWFDITA